jgi:excisionase family DNA binding protein
MDFMLTCYSAFNLIEWKKPSMSEPGLRFLSTGEVARRYGVSRDAVLKWIKKGKLPAVQTPGGHYRIPLEACDGMGMEAPVVEPEPQQEVSVGQTMDLRCWEYFGEDGNPREACETCLVFLAKAENCFRLAELGGDSGHRLHFCRNDCRTCSYYRACQGLATEVLIITRDEGMIRRLERRTDPELVSIRFARSGYEGSAVINSFSPALVIMDSDLGEVRTGSLLESILDDERIPAARVVVVARKDHAGLFKGHNVLIITAPITSETVERIAGEAAGPRARIPLDVA